MFILMTYLCSKISNMTRCFILLGSNQGDRLMLINEALIAIEKRCGNIIALSSIYESEPWGFDATTWFLNQVAIIDTNLIPEEVLSSLHDIERTLGRVRHDDVYGYESRPIDLDLLYYGDICVDSASISIPHPRLHLRRFTLMPLCEVAADYKHPILNLSHSELLSQCQDFSEVRVYDV